MRWTDNWNDAYMCWCSLAWRVGLDQRSCTTSGLVSTWMGDQLWVGKPAYLRISLRVITINGDGRCRWWQPTGGLTDQIGCLGLRVGGRLALSLHSSNEPSELLQWPCHEDSTMNISIITTIIIKYVSASPVSWYRCSVHKCHCWHSTVVSVGRLFLRH